MIEIRSHREEDIPEMARIWNEVVDEGIAFPQEDALDHLSAHRLFAEQLAVGIAEDDGLILGLYILHPNNIGRCGHIANASYAVRKSIRGCGVGRRLVEDSLRQAARLGFRILQYNAVVASNVRARSLYESMGFTQLGTIPEGFLLPDGTYADICPYFRSLEDYIDA